MRPTIPALAVAALLLTAAPASAAPTGQDRSGQTIRCATPGAMPVGWTAPPDDLRPDLSEPVNWAQIASVVFGLGGLFLLIATLPDFDGDWGEQEADKDARERRARRR